MQTGRSIERSEQKSATGRIHTNEQRAALLVSAALTYAQHGWAVFPLSGKVPYKDFHWKDEATTDENRVREFWTHHPTANIGLPTGSVTGVIVLDIDPRHADRNNPNILRVLEKRFGTLPETRTARTAHGGLHLYFQHPHDGTSYPNTVHLDGLSGLDARGDGGYVVLPPSQLYGRLAYTWGHRNLPIAPLPAWLRTCLTEERRHKESLPQEGRFALQPGQKWLTEALSQATEGNRNQVGFFLAIQLRDDGIPEAEAREIVLAYAAKVGHGKTAYTSKEALASVRSAYSRPAREPARRKP